VHNSRGPENGTPRCAALAGGKAGLQSRQTFHTTRTILQESELLCEGRLCSSSRWQGWPAIKANIPYRNNNLAREPGNGRQRCAALAGGKAGLQSRQTFHTTRTILQESELLCEGRLCSSSRWQGWPAIKANIPYRNNNLAREPGNGRQRCAALAGGKAGLQSRQTFHTTRTILQESELLCEGCLCSSSRWQGWPSITAMITHKEDDLAREPGNGRQHCEA